jgi:hypothetical protein
LTKTEEVQLPLLSLRLSRRVQNSLKFDDNGTTLVLVCVTKSGQSISRLALREFRTNSLEKDDVFRPEFYCNIVFHGSKKEDLHIEPGALEELAMWKTKTRTFFIGDPTANISPGPYAFSRGRTWQPWRIYHDSNGTFMCTFKPSPKGTGK